MVGALHVNEHGEMRFAYSPDWLKDPTRPAISLQKSSVANEWQICEVGSEPQAIFVPEKQSAS